MDACALPKTKLISITVEKDQTENASTTHILDKLKTGTLRKEKCARWTTESTVNPTNNAKEKAFATKNTPTSSWEEKNGATTTQEPVDATAEKNQRTTSVNSVLMFKSS